MTHPSWHNSDKLPRREHLAGPGSACSGFCFKSATLRHARCRSVSPHLYCLGSLEVMAFRAACIGALTCLLLRVERRRQPRISLPVLLQTSGRRVYLAFLHSRCSLSLHLMSPTHIICSARTVLCRHDFECWLTHTAAFINNLDEKSHRLTTWFAAYRDRRFEHFGG